MPRSAARNVEDLDRWRRYRQRRRSGRVVLHLDVDEDLVVGALLDSGLLDAEAALDRHAVESKLSDMLTAWAKDWQRNRYA